MISLLLTLAIGWSGVSDVVRCEIMQPQPTGYFARGYGHVAEVFPPGGRHNASSRPIVHFYQTVTRGREFSVDASRLWTAELVNPLMPAAALVSTEGYFVTLDDVGRYGGERSVVIYAPDGRLVRSFALGQLFEPAEINRIGVRTSCGIPWRDGATYYLQSVPDPRLYIVTAWGPVLEFTLGTGALSRGTLADFATLRNLVAQGYENQPEAYTLNLRFSSITDVKR